jgi:hypothetical protein
MAFVLKLIIRRSSEARSHYGVLYIIWTPCLFVLDHRVTQAACCSFVLIKPNCCLAIAIASSFMNDLRKDHDPHKNKLMPADAMKTCCDNSSESGAGVLTVMIQKSVDIKNLQQ